MITIVAGDTFTEEDGSVVTIEATLPGATIYTRQHPTGGWTPGEWTTGEMVAWLVGPTQPRRA